MVAFCRYVPYNDRCCGGKTTKINKIVQMIKILRIINKPGHQMDNTG